MEPGKRHGGLELHPGRTQNPGARLRGRISRSIKERRLTHAGLPGQQQRLPVGPGPIEKRADQRELAAPPDQSLSG